MVFGLEEVWKNKVDGPLNGPTQFDVVGPYFAGDTCLFLNTGLPDCPTTAGSGGTTTHPDQHASIWIPQADGGGHARRSATTAASTCSRPRAARRCRHDQLGPRRQPRLQHAAALRRPDREGRHDLRGPAGQRRAEDRARRHARSRSTAATAPSAPSTPTTRRSPTSPTRSTRSPRPSTAARPGARRAPPEDTYQFINPFTMDPTDASHLITAGNKVLGDHQRRGRRGTRSTTSERAPSPATPRAAAGDDDPDELRCRRSTCAGSARRCRSGGKTADFDFDGAGAAVRARRRHRRPRHLRGQALHDRARTRATARPRSRSPGTNGANDWDLVVYRKEGDAARRGRHVRLRARRPRRRRSCSPAPSRATT